MANLTSTTITGNANVTAEVNAATFAGDAGKTSNLAAGNIASGTLSTDRLPTVPVAKGGTGLTSLGSAGQVLQVSSPGGGLEFGTPASGGGYNIQVFTNPGTYTPTSGMKNIKVTVFGGGGGANGTTDQTAQGLRDSGPAGAGGAAFEELTAAQVGASQPVTVGAGGNGGNNGNSNFNPGNAGGTTSFGAFLSATGGNSGTNKNPYPGGTGPFPGNAGSGSGGNVNFSGYKDTPPLGFGVAGSPGSGSGNPGINYAAGGGGATSTPSGGTGGGDGAPGIVIVEEFL